LETPASSELDAAFGLCLGCGRTIDEIARWAAMTNEERRTIVAALPARMALAKTVKG
jgi:uncharacterized protein